MVTTDCVEKPLSRLFHRYGKFVARHPKWFIIVPTLLALSFGGGMFLLKIETGVEYLFTPTNGRAKTERSILRDIFPTNESEEFDRMRGLTLGTNGELIVTSEDGKSVLREHILEGIIALDNFVKNITLQIDENSFIHEDLCTKWKGNCEPQNLLVSLLNGNASEIAGINLTYPEYSFALPGIPSTPIPGYPVQKYRSVFVTSVFGGVQTDESGSMISAKAYKMSYFVDGTNETGTKWVREFIKQTEKKKIDGLKIAMYASITLEEELDKASGQTIALVSVVFTIMITFSIVSCLMFDWVLSKPWLGVLGVWAVALSILSTFGFLMICGLPFIAIVGVTPFVSLAIGVDDMFVLLAAWRQSNAKLSVEDRMGETFAEAVISITITTVTDVLAFGIGAITYYPSVQIFCAYTGLTVLLDFVFMITFFGGCMALIGKREHQNRHALTCMRILTKSEAENRSSCFRLCCAGGPEKKELFTNRNKPIVDDKESSTKPHAGAVFFKEWFGPFIMKVPSKVIIIILYLGYLGVSVWGCTKVQTGLDLRKLALDDSYSIDYYDLDEKYFKEYHVNVMCVIREQMDYSSNATVQDIHNLVDNLHETGYFYGREFMTFWLHDYLTYLRAYDIKYDTSNFTKILVDTFLKEPAFYKYELDIVVNDAKTEILKSRFFVQALNMTNTTRDRYMMAEARDAASSSKIDLVVYHPAFIYYDQYSTVLVNTFQNVGVAAGCMLLVSLLLIPHPVVGLWVFLSIVSITTGVLGFMTLWDEKVDGVSMVCIIMSIGFSVDFSAHTAYAYAISTDQEPNARACTALGFLGFPITQGFFSTLLGFSMLSFAPSHIFRIFFKILSLVVLIGYLHGIIILPVMMSITGRKQKGQKVVPLETKSPVVCFTIPDHKALISDDMMTWIRSVSQPTLTALVNQGSDNPANPGYPEKSNSPRRQDPRPFSAPYGYYPPLRSEMTRIN